MIILISILIAAFIAFMVLRSRKQKAAAETKDIIRQVYAIYRKKDEGSSSGSSDTKIDWDNMTCDEIDQKILEITNLLMVSKFAQEIREYWELQLAYGKKLFDSKCKASD